MHIKGVLDHHGAFMVAKLDMGTAGLAVGHRNKSVLLLLCHNHKFWL